MMFWGTSCLGTGTDIGGTMWPGAAEMGVATGAVTVDHREDDQSELTDEPHTETGVALTSSEDVAALNRELLATSGVYNGSHRELDHNSVKKKETCML